METLLIIAIVLVLVATRLRGKKGKQRPGRWARRRRGRAATRLPGKKTRRPAARTTAKKAPKRLAGAARIIDGDSLVVEGIELRLEGIDAPEHGQESLDAGGRTFAQGKYAAHYLRKLVGQAPVRCELHGGDKYGRQLATVYARDGRNVNAEMVRAGQAVAYMKFSRRYEAEEREAKKRRAGMHSGTWITPRAWRLGHRVEGMAKARRRG